MTELTFVTGAPRSGTGLLAARLAKGPGRRCVSQPAPLLLTGLKRSFLAQRGAPDLLATYPLSDQQFGTYTPPDEFTGFLGAARPSRDDWESWLTSMVGYSGQYTRPATPLAGLGALLRQVPIGALCRYLDANYTEPGGATAIVWKETFAEEFVPAILQAGHSCVLILRDPRDSIASQTGGRGEQFAGDPRPLLFMCRQWRKSALYALALKDCPGFYMVRYEDLVEAPVSTLCDHLPPEIAPDADAIRSADNTPRNSSFDSGDASPVQPIGRYKDHLAPETSAFIEALCAAEMSAFGYGTTMSPAERSTIVKRGCPDTAVGRPELSFYAWCDRHRDDELARLEAIDRPDGKFMREAFIFERAFARLRAAGSGQ
ncbi:hypothetical protein [Maricaulis sp.]|uniref:hypothetical protein n=1 Tax=Maricaulis sp. TaxID=1486257 RepID=UPI002B266FBE|nr:hypothetical protein [Maricaulis sp.]